MRAQERIVSVALPILLASLVFMTWALCSISRWIVSHDHVWQKMKADGDLLLWYLAEGFTQLHALAVVPIVAVLSVTVLIAYYASGRVRPRK